MRTMTLVGLAALLVGCGGQDNMTADLRDDLSLAKSSDALLLASAENPGTAVVAAVEQTTPRATAPAPSVRAPRPRPAVAPPVEAAPIEQVEEQVELAAAIPEPEPVEDRGSDGMGTSAIPTPRPVPVESGGGRVAGSGGGPGIGTILAGIGIAVIRGGGVGVDRCDPRTDGRRNVAGDASILINQRMPIIRGTYPTQ